MSFLLVAGPRIARGPQGYEPCEILLLHPAICALYTNFPKIQYLSTGKLLLQRSDLRRLFITTFPPPRRVEGEATFIFLGLKNVLPSANTISCTIAFLWQLYFLQNPFCFLLHLNLEKPRCEHG